MTPQEKQLLLKYKSHYLWDKPRRKWTEQDLINLQNGICEKPPSQRRKDRSVKVTFNGQTYIFETAKEVAEKFNIKNFIVYNILYGNRKQLKWINIE